MALMDSHIINGLLAVINGLHVFIGQFLLVADKYVRMSRTTSFAFDCFGPINAKTGAFLSCCQSCHYKENAFFLFVGDSFCHFLRYIYGACLVIGD